MNGPIIFKYTKVPSISVNIYNLHFSQSKVSYISIIVAIVDARVKEVSD